MERARIICRLLTDFATFLWLFLRPHRAVAAENLFLRKQLAMYRERGVRPRRTDPASRVSLVLLSMCFDWRETLFNVTPQTFVRWHRQGFRLFWRWKSRPGRPAIPREVQALIRRMARENPCRSRKLEDSDFSGFTRLRHSPPRGLAHWPEHRDRAAWQTRSEAPDAYTRPGVAATGHERAPGDLPPAVVTRTDREAQRHNLRSP